MNADKKKRKKSVFLRVALFAFSVYVVVALVQLQLELREKESREAAIVQEIERQKAINEGLKNMQENEEDYKEQQARENGKVRPGEQIYQEIPNNG